MSWERKPRLTPSERAQKAIEAAEAAVIKNEEGEPIAGPFYGLRRRGGAGVGKRGRFAQTMAIPKKKR